MPLYQENANHFDLLPTVSVSSNTILNRAEHAGKYLICAGAIVLPSTSTAESIIRFSIQQAATSRSLETVI